VPRREELRPLNKKKMSNPLGYAQERMVTGGIEPCIILLQIR